MPVLVETFPASLHQDGHSDSGNLAGCTRLRPPQGGHRLDVVIHAHGLQGRCANAIEGEWKHGLFFLHDEVVEARLRACIGAQILEGSVAKALPPLPALTQQKT